MTDVLLTWGEVRLAALAGVDQVIYSRSRRARHAYGAANDDAWQISIQGQLAEYAVAKALDAFWHAAKDVGPRVGDVGRLEVRATLRQGGSLIVHESDPDEACFVLVTGDAPTLRLVGWLRGADAKQPRYWRTDVRHPAFFVPPAMLHGLDELT